MKKTVAFFLTLMLILAFAPVSSLTASAASNTSSVEDFCYIKDNIEYKVSIKHTKKWLGYESCLIFEKTTTTGRTTTTKQYISTCRTYSKTPPTAKQICNRDSKLRSTDIYSKMESLHAYYQLLTNSQYLSKLAKESFDSVAMSELKKNMKGEVISCSLEKLGFNIDILDFISDASGSGLWAKLIEKDVKKILSSLGITLYKESEPIRKGTNREVVLSPIVQENLELYEQSENDFIFAFNSLKLSGKK